MEGQFPMSRQEAEMDEPPPPTPQCQPTMASNPNTFAIVKVL